MDYIHKYRFFQEKPKVDVSSRDGLVMKTEKNEFIVWKMKIRHRRKTPESHKRALIRKFRKSV